MSLEKFHNELLALGSHLLENAGWDTGDLWWATQTGDHSISDTLSEGLDSQWATSASKQFCEHATSHSVDSFANFFDNFDSFLGNSDNSFGDSSDSSFDSSDESLDEAPQSSSVGSSDLVDSPVKFGSDSSQQHSLDVSSHSGDVSADATEKSDHTKLALQFAHQIVEEAANDSTNDGDTDSSQDTFDLGLDIEQSSLLKSLDFVIGDLVGDDTQ